MEDPEEDLEYDPELGEQHANHDIEDAKLGASGNNFDLGEDLGGESNLDCDPSRDH